MPATTTTIGFGGSAGAGASEAALGATTETELTLYMARVVILIAATLVHSAVSRASVLSVTNQTSNMVTLRRFWGNTL